MWSDLRESGHYPPSWVGASSLLKRGYWVNRLDKCFTVELQDWVPERRQPPLRLPRDI